MSKLTKALTAAAGNAGESLYVEDVFSTYLYTGNGTSQTITNGIDLAGAGGLVWKKQREDGDWNNHYLVDSERDFYGPFNQTLITNSTAGNGSFGGGFIPLSDGFTLPDAAIFDAVKESVSWTFRKAEKFFDVVTYTGDGSNRTISHSLGSVPGFIVVKRTDASGNSWYCYHSSLGNTKRILLSETDPEGTDSTVWNSTTPTDSVFSLGTNVNVNASGGTYVAYLFASDAGGFGNGGSENIIKCGSYDANLNEVVDLGFEPQFIIYKSTATAAWRMADTMRGWTANDTNTIKQLFPNLTNAESDNTFARPTPTGFIINQSGGGQKHIYIAIRRPMKTPESGTEVFSVSDSMSGGTQPAFNAPHVCDMAFQRRPAFTQTTHIASRLTGTKNLYTDTTAAEVNQVENVWDFMDGWGGWTVTNTDYRAWNFKRATGFMDVVAYIGTGTNPTNFNHNLDAIPELMIFKKRSATDRWEVYSAALGNTKRIDLNTDGAATTVSIWGGTPTATQFSLTDNSNVNQSGQTYISYLFATVAGVSKVGSYTGTGSDLNVDCGFSAGARFILIKRTDSTGDWYYWDYERGIVAGNDPYLLINSTAAEVTNTDYIDPLSSGFTVTSNASGTVNVSGGTYIFLAIA